MSPAQAGDFPRMEREDALEVRKLERIVRRRLQDSDCRRVVDEEIASEMSPVQRTRLHGDADKRNLGTDRRQFPLGGRRIRSDRSVDRLVVGQEDEKRKRGVEFVAGEVLDGAGDFRESVVTGAAEELTGRDRTRTRRGAVRQDFDGRAVGLKEIGIRGSEGAADANDVAGAERATAEGRCIGELSDALFVAEEQNALVGIALGNDRRRDVKGPFDGRRVLTGRLHVNQVRHDGRAGEDAEQDEIRDKHTLILSYSLVFDHAVR